MNYTFQLCEGRHPIPGNPPAIFPATATVDPTNTIALYNCATFNIPTDATEITVYVTGLTSAMLAVVRVCNERGVSLMANTTIGTQMSTIPSEYSNVLNGRRSLPFNFIKQC